MSQTHETLEKIEHIGHGDGHSDPMMMRVAMTMAIIAATLAAVSVTGHRKHNAVLQLQGDANRMLTEADRIKPSARLHHAGVKGEVTIILERYANGQTSRDPKTIVLSGDGVTMIGFEELAVPASAVGTGAGADADGADRWGGGGERPDGGAVSRCHAAASSRPR